MRGCGNGSGGPATAPEPGACTARWRELVENGFILVQAVNLLTLAIIYKRISSMPESSTKALARCDPEPRSVRADGERDGRERPASRTRSFSVRLHYGRVGSQRKCEKFKRERSASVE